MVAYHTVDVSIIQKYCSLWKNKEQLSDHKEISVEKCCPAEHNSSVMQHEQFFWFGF
jgi:hypothetical protein